MSSVKITCQGKRMAFHVDKGDFVEDFAFYTRWGDLSTVSWLHGAFGCFEILSPTCIHPAWLAAMAVVQAHEVQ